MPQLRESAHPAYPVVAHVLPNPTAPWLRQALQMREGLWYTELS